MVNIKGIGLLSRGPSLCPCGRLLLSEFSLSTLRSDLAESGTTGGNKGGKGGLIGCVDRVG